jgi:hypothetical protein
MVTLTVEKWFSTFVDKKFFFQNTLSTYIKEL